MAAGTKAGECSEVCMLRALHVAVPQTGVEGGSVCT